MAQVWKTVLAAVFVLPDLAMATEPPPLALVAAPPAAIEAPVAGPIVSAGTQLSLMIMNEVSTKTARVGDRFPVRLDRPVIVDGRVVIAEGAMGIGEVVSAAESGIAGKSGKLATRLLHLDVGKTRLKISGDPRSAGQGGTLQIALATLALTPWGLFARGNNAKLKAGDIIVGVLVDPYVPASLPVVSDAAAAPVVNP